MCFLFHALSLYHGKSDYITPVYGEWQWKQQVLELIGLLVRVARQRRRDGLKLAVSVFLAHLTSDQFQSVFVYWWRNTYITVLLYTSFYHGQVIVRSCWRTYDSCYVLINNCGRIEAILLRCFMCLDVVTCNDTCYGLTLIFR